MDEAVAASHKKHPCMTCLASGSHRSTNTTLRRLDPVPCEQCVISYVLEGIDFTLYACPRHFIFFALKYLVLNKRLHVAEPGLLQVFDRRSIYTGKALVDDKLGSRPTTLLVKLVGFVEDLATCKDECVRGRIDGAEVDLSFLILDIAIDGEED